MTTINRRQFVAGASAVVPVTALRLRTHHRGMALDPALLRALAEAVLPMELEAHTVARIAATFARWLEKYRPGTERNHGYGTGEIEQLPESPASLWDAQLVNLDEQARTKHGKGFSQIDAQTRRELVRARLRGVALDRMPDPLRAPHVAVGLLAHFYDSPEATDLCYRAAIGRMRCRPLDRAAERPATLETGGP